MAVRAPDESTQLRLHVIQASHADAIRIKEEYVFLRHAKKVTWRSILYQLIEVKNKDAWKVILCLAILVSFNLVSYWVVVMREPFGSNIYSILILCDMIYAIDYFLAVWGFFCKEAHIHLSKDARSITRIIIDAFFVNLHFHLVHQLMEHFNFVNLILSLPYYLRLYHVHLFFRDKIQSAGVNHGVYFLIEYLINTLVLHHTVACIWYLEGKPIIASRNPPTVYKGWMVTDKVGKGTVHNIYFNALYFALMTTTTSGFGDLHVGNAFETVLCIFAMCIGFCLTTGVFIGFLTADFINRFRRRELLRIQIANINQQLKRIHLEENGTREIREYYNILWQEKKGVQFAAYLNLLPFPLRTEICFDINILPLLGSIIFQKKPEPFLRTVAYKMKHEFYQPNDMIFPQGIVKNRMIFVVLGVVEILSEEDDQSPVIAFRAGSCFGEASLIITLPARCSLRAACYTELQILERRDFLEILELYPAIYQEILTDIFQRVTDARNIISRSKETGNQFGFSLFVSQYETQTPVKQLKDKLNGISKNKFYYDKYISLYRLTSNIRSRTNTSICVKQKWPWIIHPKGSLATIWEAVVVITALIIGVLYPYYTVFVFSFPRWLYVFSHFVDLIFMMDIYLNLTTGIIKKKRLLRKVSQIFDLRLQEWGFYLNILSALHIEVFTLASPVKFRSRLFYFCKLNRLLKIYRIPKLFFTIENSIGLPVLPVSLAKHPIYLLYCSYWLSVIFYVSVCPKEVCRWNCWYMELVRKAIAHNYRYACSYHKATVSYYFALSCLSTVGFGDIYPGSIQDALIVHIFIIVGILVFGYCTADLSAVITHKLKSRKKFQASLYSVKRFINDKKISYTIKKRIINFFVLQWYYDEGVTLEKKDIFYNASSRIQRDILVKARREAILRTPIFQETNMDFIELIVMGARTLILPPNEYVTYHGTMIPEFYVIQEGYCRRFTVVGSDSGLEIGTSEVLEPSDQFGVASILKNCPCIETVLTLTHVKLLGISSQLFWSASSMFPQLRKAIEESANEVLDKEKFVNKFIQSNVDVKKVNLTKTNNQYKSGSFLNVYTHCKRTNEDYDEPFRQMGHYHWCKYLLLPICIMPNGTFIKIWVYFRLVVAVIVTLLIPYQLILAPYAPALDLTMILLDMVAYIDLYVLLLVGYYGEKNQLIVHPLKTAVHYLKGKFTVDLLLCFPYELILIWIVASHSEGHTDRAHIDAPHMSHCILRALNIFQLYRLPQALNYLKGNIRKKLSHWTEILKFFLLAIIFLNLCSGLVIKLSCKYYCIHDLTTNQLSFINNKKYLNIEGMARLEIVEYAMICQEESWLDRSSFSSVTDPFAIFILGFYFSANSLTGSGMGDITPRHLNQLYMTMITIICGTLFFSYVFAKICSQKTTTYSALADSQERIKELSDFMAAHNVSNFLQNEIVDFLEYRWKRTKGANPEKILSNLHTALYEDAVLDIYAATLREVPLFETKDKSFLGLLGKEVKERYYVRGETIFRAQDIVEHLFIILRGKVEIVSHYNDMVAYMGVGGIFGNISQHSKHKINVTIKALSNLDALYIRTEDFYLLVKKYHSMKETVDKTLAQKLDFILPTTMIFDEEDEAEGVTDVEEFQLRFSKQPDRVSLSSAGSGTKSELSTSSYHTRRQNLFGLTLIFLPHKWGRVALLPHLLVFGIMDFSSMVLAFLNYFLVIYEFIFYHHTPEYFLGFTIAVDFFFFLKIFLEMHKAYENRYGDFVTNNRRIMKRFFAKKWKRAVELIANLPIYYFALLLPRHHSYFVFATLRLVTIMRVTYIIEFYVEKSNKLWVNRVFLEICAISMGIAMILHTVACGWYFVACPWGHCHQRQWITEYHEPKHMDSNLYIYMLCIYFAINILTNVGIGDIRPTNLSEVIFTTLVIIVAKFLIGVFIADMMNVLASANAALDNYEYGIKELRDYLINGNLSNYQMQKMWKYVKRLWSKNGGKQIPRLMPKLHYTHKCDLMSEIYGLNLRNSYIFADTEECFIRQLCGRIELTIFFPGNYIVQHGDSNLSMYFIYSGEIEILTVHPNLTETVHEVLSAGDMFGLGQGLFHGVPHYFSFRAKTVVEVIRLCLPEWEDLLNFFPRSKEIIYERVHDVYTKV